MTGKKAPAEAGRRLSGRLLTSCLFTSDLHGHVDRCEKLFEVISVERHSAVLLGGDILPSGFGSLCFTRASHEDFINDYLAPTLAALKLELESAYPRIFVILGNDDPRVEEAAVCDRVGQ
ncbi:metallophosphoesterase [Gemmatimonadota bacterium]